MQEWKSTHMCRSALCTMDDASYFLVIRLGPKTSQCEKNVIVLSTVTGNMITRFQKRKTVGSFRQNIFSMCIQFRLFFLMFFSIFTSFQFFHVFRFPLFPFFMFFHFFVFHFSLFVFELFFLYCSFSLLFSLRPCFILFVNFWFLF